jgi:phage repressor protein C with HTH and peptisase S24 domain
MTFFMVDARETLERLIAETGADCASLSRLIGRNAAYVQQFIRRGVPKKLDEGDRAKLARFFGIDEVLLGAPHDMPALGHGPKAKSRMIAVPRLAVRASAGPGALGEDEGAMGQFGFDARWMRGLSTNPASLSAIRVQGDSMMPTLSDGDDIMVDRSDGADRLRDGIYVLRIDDALNVKRLAINPVRGSVTIHSDNPAYPSWPDCDLSQIVLIGRVVWVGRRL